MSTRTISILALTLLFGGAAALGVNQLTQQKQGSVSPTAERVPVVVAAADLSRGVIVSSLDQLAIQDFPKELVPPGAITKKEDALERAVMYPLFKGDVLSDVRLSAKYDTGGLASLIPEGMRAFTIQTASVAANVAGFVMPDNRVDVLLTINGSDAAGGGITTTLLQNVKILAVEKRLDAPKDSKVDTGTQSVTLLVTPDQAAKLDLGQNRGMLHLTLRNPKDGMAANTRPATLSGLLYYQEKPWDERFKNAMATAVKALADSRVKQANYQATPSTPAAPAASPTQVHLQIRTLRGGRSGVINVEPADETEDRTSP